MPTAAAGTDPRVLLLQRLAAAEAAHIARTNANGQRLASATLAGFTDWYAAAAIAQLADQLLEVAAPVRDLAGQAGQAYMTQLLTGLGKQVPTTKPVTLPAPRLGADMRQVYSRPATTYRWTFATTGSVEEATSAAAGRFARLMADDAMVAHRDAERALMQALEVKRYRRVIHPERSRGGTCGLCIAAAQRVYTIGTLMALHDRCECTSAPILGSGDDDPGHLANSIDLADLYDAAGGSSNRQDLSHTRFQVDEHGELGPVLTAKGDHFQDGGPRSLTAEQAAAELEKLEPVLGDLEKQAAAGHDVAGPLRYQQAVVDKRRKIAGDTPTRSSSGSSGGSGGGSKKPPTGGSGGGSGEPPEPGRFNSNGATLEDAEQRFVERFTRLGHSADWIPKQPSYPTHDFTWTDNDGLLIELKSPKARWKTIETSMWKSVKKAADPRHRPPVTKENFVIDLGENPLTDELRTQLATYNDGRLEHRIARLWVMHSDGAALEEIALNEKK